MRPLRSSLALLAAASSLVLARDAAATENWNQWDDAAVSGVARGATKVSLGVDWAHVPGAHALRLGAQVEHLLRDRWGVTASFGLPVDGEWVAPALLGLRLHVLPKTPLDPFVGVAGGVAWLRPSGRDARLDPMASAQAGATLYYFGLFFLEIEARYDAVRYAATSGAVDESGFAFAGRTGVFF